MGVERQKKMGLTQVSKWCWISPIFRRCLIVVALVGMVSCGCVCFVIPISIYVCVFVFYVLGSFIRERDTVCEIEISGE